MVIEALNLALPWNWFDSHSVPSSPEKRRSHRKTPRTRAEQLARDAPERRASTGEARSEGYYPGLINISGTFCFMDSTLQAMASLSYLQPYIETIHSTAEALDVPTPVIDALRKLLDTLNTPTSSRRSLRPDEIIAALSDHAPGKHTSLFSSREHQDAQELFQLVSECIKNEAASVDKEGHRDRGLGGLAQVPGYAGRELGKSVFDGLTANRRSCVECGYTEAVMHFAFDNWQLAVPRLAGACRLEDCLEDYTRLELLTDCICRKCSMLATYERLAREADKLVSPAHGEHEVSASRKKRAREAKKLVLRVKAALNDGRIEEDISGVKMEKVFSKASTKQAMVARPPPVLALHLNRSVHYGHYAAKNNVRVVFPELLDLTPFTTSGQLSTIPSVPISTPSPSPSNYRCITPTPASCATPRTLYRLAAVVCHYGGHSFGHYVCFRRKPRPVSTGPRRFAPPRLVCPLGCECIQCQRAGPVRDDMDDPGPDPGRGWLRISDDAVRECGIETVLQEGAGAFMLYYERVVMPRPSIYMSGAPRGSEETLRPEVVHAAASGSKVSLSSVQSLAPAKDDQAAKIAAPIPVPAHNIRGPRIVRNVSAHRVKTLSMSPPEHEPVVSPPQPAIVSATAASTSLKLPNGDTKTHPQNRTLAKANGNGASISPAPKPEESLPALRSTTPASPVRQSSSSHLSASSASPSIPRPPRHTHHPTPPARIKSPPPIQSSTARPLSPARMVGLRA
ncbi:hypothetical protein B0H21DRAFT_689520 [Amylocystis lapponica]|nr:hypothetical protein B0H21DRAFT_689520 [Amylocystis lapponica]